MTTPRIRPIEVIIAAAVVATLLIVIVWPTGGRYRAYYRERAASFARGEAHLLEQIAEALASARQADARGPEGKAEAEALRAEAERLARLGAWHVKLEQKYAWAAEHPFAPLPPDPPPPD